MYVIMEDTLVIELTILVVLLAIARVLYLIHKITNGFSKVALTKRTVPAKTMICIGSGGHTTEMLCIIKNLNFNRYSPRNYIIANTDSTSLKKVNEMESMKN
ncbi:hypothetical protein AMK59_5181, partial [Oryctes borbonicus]